MPPVRWRLLLLVSILGGLKPVISEEFISMTADGWKPIVGNGGPRQAVIEDEITQYRNPSDFDNKQKIYKSQTQIPAQTYPPKVISIKTDQNHNVKTKNGVNRIQAHATGSLNNISPHSKHNHKLLLVSSTGGTLHRQTSSNKHSVVGIKKTKPVRSQVGAYSAKNEIYVPAPSSALGSFVYFNSGRNSLKVRDVPLKHVHNQGANNPHRYTSFFTLPGLPSPRPTPPQNFIFPNKHHVQNDMNYYSNQQQNDEYSKNLVPPPPETPADEKDQKVINYQQQQQQQLAIQLPENLVVQVPPAFDQQNDFAQKNPTQQRVEVTKENLNVFRNTVPLNYQETNLNVYQEPSISDQYQKFVQKTKQPPLNLHTYEVTEGTYWESHISTTRSPSNDPSLVFNQYKRPLLPAEDPTVKTFLPTPIKSEVSPTLASQKDKDVSAIYSEVNVKNRLKYKPNFSSFNIKEVSTHYPIMGNPKVQSEFENSDLTNEITTKEEFPEKTIPQNTNPSYVDWQNQQEPQLLRPHRRRRPIRPKIASTTTPSTYPTSNTITEIPETTTQHKRRRLIKQRITTTSTTTELPAPNPSSHNFAANSDDQYQENSFVDSENIYQNKPDATSVKSSESYRDDAISPAPEEYTISTYEISKDYIPQSKVKNRKRIQTTTETPHTTTDNPTVETEFFNNNDQNEYTETTAEEPSTTLATTSTTTESTTTKANRIKARPIKNKNRPRFSVKDYRQRFNDHLSSPSSTSTTSTTEKPRTRDPSVRLRFPNRGRKPLPVNKDEDVTAEPASKFSPKEPRYTTPEMDSFTIATEKPVRAVNTRLRPFGRYRSTTTTTSTESSSTPSQRASLKPSLFGTGRRPAYPNLKTRIMNKYNRTQTTTTTTSSTTVKNEEDEEDEENMSEEVQTPVSITAKMDIDEETENDENKMTEDEEKQENLEMQKTTTNEFSADPEQDESMIQQRISDLTSSADNKYNTPGMFKSLSATSRIIPSHFTIATEDPVLPIETFFSSFKEGARSDSKK